MAFKAQTSRLGKSGAERSKKPNSPERGETGRDLSRDTEHLKKILGTTDDHFAVGVLGQISTVGSDGKIDPGHLRFMLSLIEGIHPRDQIEGMLAAQMASVHVLTMFLAQRLADADDIAKQDSCERALNKLARTFTAQMEALRRYRSGGGEQNVTVQNMSVNEGGQAIVGNVTQAPPAHALAQTAEARPALTDARQHPMPIVGERVREQVLVERNSKNDTPA